jgi:hypothetical protein
MQRARANARSLLRGLRMKKSDVTVRYERGVYRPAINVKVYKLGLDAGTLADERKCARATAEQALQFAFDSQQQQFWEQIEETAREIFGSHIRVFSDGRSSGWLVLHNLPDVETWDAVALGKFAKFEKLVRADIAWRTSAETLREDIDANEWCKPGAELYNFVDTPNGPRCIADMKQEAIAAGFGPVIKR